MGRLRVLVNFKHMFCVFLLFFSCGHLTNVPDSTGEYLSDRPSEFNPSFVLLEQTRFRRDVTTPDNHTTLTPPAPSATTVNATPGSDKTLANATEKGTSTTTPVTVTHVPLLGVNGSGQLHVTPGNIPKVSDPIVADDSDITDDLFVKETPERIASEQNLTNLTYEDHDFYNSTFIGNLDYFNEYWANITSHKATVHSVLSNSYRRATSVQLSFEFPFYGHNIRNITVATGGFMYTGEHVHNWLAATQYIAPMMANFDTTLTNDSVVKLFDDGDRFSAFWENVTLQEEPNLKFTFAVTLYKNGDIIFAYKNIPIDVQQINDTDHPVKVGISDAYLTDKIVFYVRRKTIYEYHRVSFKDHLISNNTVLKMTALPTCLQYTTCDSCVNHNTGFNCTWCPSIGKCSSGTDRNKQDWLLRRCDKITIVNAMLCPPSTGNDTAEGVHTSNTAYSTDQQSSTGTDTVIKTGIDSKPVSGPSVAAAPAPEVKSSIGGVVAAFLTLTLLCSAVAWVLYAFKNPHTRSGQLLIKYRPSQWNWRRGEARYTAATIHM